MNDPKNQAVGLVLLSFASGTMDAIAFLTLGEIFTSAMSGNTILFGLAVGQGRMFAAAHSLAAFIGYVVGVVGATLSLRAPAGIARTLILETMMLAGFAGLWTIAHGPLHASDAVVYGLIALSSIAMGLQGALGRSIQVPGIMTTVFTATLTALIVGLAERGLAGARPLFTPPTRRQLAAFLAYLASAVTTGFAFAHALPGLAFIPLAAVGALVVGLRLCWVAL